MDQLSILLPSVWLGLTVGQIIVLMLWLGINVGGVMIQSDPMSNVRLCLAWAGDYLPVAKPKRAAHIAVAQLPFVFALAAKNSLTSLLGKDYARLNFLHRFCGRMIVLCGAFHGGLYLFSPTLSVVQAGSTMRLWGMSSVGCLSVALHAMVSTY